MSKSIAFFIRSLHIGGAEKQSILLVEELSKDFNVFLIVLYQEGELIKLVKNPSLVIYLKGSILSKITQFFFILKTHKISHLFNFLPVNNIIGSVIGKLAGVKYIYNGIRGSKIKSNIFKMKLQLFLSNYISYKVISNSYKGKLTYSNYGYKKDKIVVIHNMMIDLISLSSINEDFKKKVSNKIKILAVGRFVNEKDYPTMINSIIELSKLTESHDFHWELNIVGYGPLKKDIYDLVKQNNLAEKVNFHKGNIINVKDSYRNSDIYLSTSKFEGMSNTIMEAMSCGLPIVTTDAGDSSYLVKSKVNGFICPVGDYKKLSEHLLELLMNKKMRYDFGVNGHKILEESFSKSNIINKYKSLIEL